jgi:hypothetical protein
MLGPAAAATERSAPQSGTLPGVPGGSGLARERPGETPTEAFLLSRCYCGSPSLGYRATAVYLSDALELDDAMAISGAAFSPVQTSNPLIGFLMMIFNMRLGQWLPDPRLDAQGRWGPTGHALLLDWFRRWRERAHWHFVTDGGHHENLGLWPLLERRCRLIIVSDASQDRESAFADLLRVLRRARFEWGIRITGLAPSQSFRAAEDQDDVASLLTLLRPSQPSLGIAAPKRAQAGASQGLAPRSLRHFFFAHIEYPAIGVGPHQDKREGYLVYLKPTLTGDESAELQGYAALNPDFPHNPTMDQLYDEDRFESYRQLGEHIGERLCAELAPQEHPMVEGLMWDWPIGSDDLIGCFDPPPTPQSRALQRLDELRVVGTAERNGEAGDAPVGVPQKRR